MLITSNILCYLEHLQQGNNSSNLLGILIILIKTPLQQLIKSTWYICQQTLSPRAYISAHGVDFVSRIPA